MISLTKCIMQPIAEIVKRFIRNIFIYLLQMKNKKIECYKKSIYIMKKSTVKANYIKINIRI